MRFATKIERMTILSLLQKSGKQSISFIDVNSGILTIFQGKYHLTDDEYGTPEGQSDPSVQNSVSVHHPL